MSHSAKILRWSKRTVRRKKILFEGPINIGYFQEDKILSIHMDSPTHSFEVQLSLEEVLELARFGIGCEIREPKKK